MTSFHTYSRKTLYFLVQTIVSNNLPQSWLVLLNKIDYLNKLVYSLEKGLEVFDSNDKDCNRSNRCQQCWKSCWFYCMSRVYDAAVEEEIHYVYLMPYHIDLHFHRVFQVALHLINLAIETNMKSSHEATSKLFAAKYNHFFVVLSDFLYFVCTCMNWKQHNSLNHLHNPESFLLDVLDHF